MRKLTDQERALLLWDEESPMRSLHQVTTNYFVAGYSQDQNGKILSCAPILKKKLDYWRTVSVLICPGEQLDYDQWEERRSERSRLIVRLMNDFPCPDPAA